MTLNTTLEDARVLVVGASSGIGRALAEHAFVQGARVSCAARRTEPLNEVIAGHPKGVAITADIRNAEDCRHIVAESVGVMLAIPGVDFPDIYYDPRGVPLAATPVL